MKTITKVAEWREYARELEIISGTKWCKFCETRKRLEEFPLNPRGKYGRHSKCRDCGAKWSEDRRRRANPDSRVTRYKRSPKGKETYMRNRLKDHGLTLDQFEAIKAAQGNLCALCNRPETCKAKWSDQPKELSIDHDHACCPGRTSCGECVRGLLCQACNSRMGGWEAMERLARETGADLRGYARNRLDLTTL